MAYFIPCLIVLLGILDLFSMNKKYRYFDYWEMKVFITFQIIPLLYFEMDNIFYCAKINELYDNEIEKMR